MVSIAQYISEGFLRDLDKRFQQTAFAKTADKVNVKIDNFLSKSAIGRGYMKLEDSIDEDVRRGVNLILNTKDRLLRRNFRIRR